MGDTSLLEDNPAVCTGLLASSVSCCAIAINGPVCVCVLIGQMDELETLAQESSQVRDELDILRHTAEKVARSFLHVVEYHGQQWYCVVVCTYLVVNCS